MDQLKSMRVFVHVVDGRSFTKAAVTAGLSQSAVSIHIAQLERKLGVRLVTRTTRSVRPTDEGLAYYAHCQRVLSDMDDTESALANAAMTISGRLRIDITVTLANRLLIPVLPGFLNRHPDIKVELHQTGHVFDAEHETYDVLFRAGNLKDSDLVAKRMSEVKMAIAGSPRYFAQHGIPKVPGDLLNHNCLNYIIASTGHIPEWIFERGKKRQVLKVSGSIFSNQNESLIQAAVAGIGLVHTPAFEIASLVKQGMLQTILNEWKIPSSPLWIAYPKNRFLSARVRTFVEYMLDCYPPTQLLDLEAR